MNLVGKLDKLKFLLFFVVLVKCQNLDGDEASMKKYYEAKCLEFGKRPFFDLDLLVQADWRIFYSWNLDIGDRCIDMRFRIASPEIVRQTYNDMKSYLREEPMWGSAILLMSMGRTEHEMLLFDDQGPAGRFTGVPNVVKDGIMAPIKNAIPLLKFYMKMFNGGRFMVVMDCDIGVVTLAARLDKAPTREEVAVIAPRMGLGQGSFACFPEQQRIGDLIVYK